jgi:hypothetical protein
MSLAAHSDGIFSVEDHGLGQSVSTSGLSADLDIEHLSPHVAGAGLAEVDLDLDGRLQGLDVVEDQREGDETSGDGHSREDDGTKGHGSEGLGLLLHCF